MEGKTMATKNSGHSFSGGRRLAITAALAGAAVLAANGAPASPLGWLMGGSGKRLTGNGEIRQQTRELGAFTGIALGLPGTAELRIGDTESITIETDDNLMSQVDTVVEDGTLKIRAWDNNMRLAPTRLRFVIQAKSISQLAVGGSGAIVANSLPGNSVRFDVGGSGSISIKTLRTGQATVAIGGSGNFSAGGRTRELKISIGGSGQADAGKLDSDNVSVSIGGSGQATVSARQALAVSIGGSGNVEYYGDPQQLSKSVAGSGSITRVGPAPR
jgi:hypothetical protein